MTVVDLGMNIGRRKPHRGWSLRNPYNERLPSPMKVTIEIEATSDAFAMVILKDILARATQKRMFLNETHHGMSSIQGDGVASVIVDRIQATEPETPPSPFSLSPGARRAVSLERIADTLDLIEGHMRPVITEAPELPPRYTLAQNGRDVIDHGSEGHRDNMSELIYASAEKITQRVRDNLRWISNIAYNMKQGVSASNIGPEAEFDRIYVMINAVAVELGVKLP